MESLKSHLFHLLSGEDNICCLCLRNVDQKYFCTQDLITYEYSKNITEIEVTDILKLVLGLECVQNLTTDVICRNCLKTSLKFYKFINSCRENSKYLTNAFGILEKLSEDTVNEENEYKTLYLSVNEYTFTGTQIYDHKSVTGNCKKALKRLKVISNPKQINKYEKVYESDEEIDDLQCFTKKTKPKRKKSTKDFSNILDVNNQSTFKCKICQRIFSSLYSLRRHFVRLHSPKDFICYKCNKGFGSSEFLEEHRQTCHSGVKFMCMECGKKYADKKSLRLHELSHTLLLKCEACGKIFNNHRSYNYHVDNKKCDVVPKKSKIERKYVCDHCDKKYACKGTLRVHIQLEHGYGRSHICSWCGKAFSHISRLKSHIVTHTQEKKFSCEICGGCFVTKESLLYHTRTHTGEKPYQCELCDQWFLSTSRRAEHVRRRHKDPMLRCDVCPAKFNTRSTLVKHKKRHYDPCSRLHLSRIAEKCSKLEEG